MENKAGRLFWHWLAARRWVLLYLGAVFGFFFLVYALHGYPWGVAGYAALLGLGLGAGLGLWDYARFAAKHRELARLAGRFPTSPPQSPENLIEADYQAIITALEAERARLESQNEHVRRDAEEYYALWAHQVKTPMAAMRLLLQSGAEQPGGREKADLEQELFRIGQYVEMVLQYQRLSSLQNDLVLREHQLSALAKKAAKGCATLFIHKGLALELEGVAGTVVTDEKWFCFVLEQLYTNAVKYTRAGAVRLYCPDAHTLVVEDTGIGIPPADLPRVFERGFTGTVGRSERSSTGIGLYLCRAILGRLGFGISIESQPGRGTRVLLHLEQAALEVE